jgi:ribonuclease BN (tRNA processing enzyme)
VGYLLRKGSRSYLYSGDTGPTERIWRSAGKIDAVIVELSFPDSMMELALASGHLTPRLLKGELAKMAALPGRILLTHLKPQFIDQIVRDVSELAIPRVEFLQAGAIYDL